MRSTSRRRTLLAVALAVTVVGAGAACSDDDDAGTGTSAGPSTGTVEPDPGGDPTLSDPASAGDTPGSAVPLTEPAVPALDDTVQLGGSQLATVDLGTGTATPLGRIGGDEEVGVLGLAFVPGATSTVYGLTDAPELVTFDTSDPSRLLTTVPIEGVASGSTLLALDVDLEDGTLYALSDAAVLYSIEPTTGVATAIGTGLGEPLADPGFGFDVDPTTALLRVEVATGEHLLVVSATGTVDADAETVIGQPVSYDPADESAAIAPRIVALAFTANGELYGVDAATGNLVRQDPPDAGVLTTVGPLGVDLTDGASFDISPTGQALLAVPG
ncbi:MAG: DUF4394 domain-containing protein [Ilumatobacteraceae bacterium]